MGLFTSLQIRSLEDLLVHDLQDLYDAENRLCDALPKMAQAAHSPRLQQAFREHLDQTKHQVSRLEDILRHLGQSVDGATCDAMVGLIKEAQDIIDADADPDVRDAGLIGCAQKVEHYEIAGYGTCRTFADRLGFRDACDLLQQSLDEEGETDKKLTSLAEGTINVQAQRKG